MTPEGSRRFAGRLAILVGVWTVPVVVAVAGFAFGGVAGNGGMRAAQYVGHSVAMWYVWIPATPLVFAIHRREIPVVEALLVHAGALVAVLITQAWLAVAVGHLTGHVIASFGFRQNLNFAAANLLPYDTLVYMGVVAAASGIDYARRYRDRDLQASQLETQLERARLEALQVQLQPHFVFNALNTVAMLIRRDQKQQAVDMVVGLGELLRYVLEESGTMDVPLEHELAFVRRYLEIARARFGDSLTVSIDVGGDAGRAVIPNLLLQPLVENALKHGVGMASAGERRGGHVWIRCERRGLRLRLEVADDGPGLPADFDLAQTEGIGLRNLQQRLALLCGEDSSLTMSARSDAGGGTTAVIEIPFNATADGAHRPLQLATRE